MESAAAAAKSLQSCPTLCDPIDGSPPGSRIPGILQARTLEWVAISFSNAWKWKVKSENEVAQLCPTLHDPMDCSLPGSSIHGIFQARVLEWDACKKNKHKASGRMQSPTSLTLFLPLLLPPSPSVPSSPRVACGSLGDWSTVMLTTYLLIYWIDVDIHGT